MISDFDLQAVIDTKKAWDGMGVLRTRFVDYLYRSATGHPAQAALIDWIKAYEKEHCEHLNSYDAIMRAIETNTRYGHDRNPHDVAVETLNDICIGTRRHIIRNTLR